MESTGVFSKTVQRALAAAGGSLGRHARHVKRVPGRKTDVSDSQWLATLARYGLVSPSFLAPPQLEELRRLTRLYARTRRLASTLRNMLHRMLDESGLRIGGILTDLFGLSGRNLLDGLLEGCDPEQMVAGVKGKARKKVPALLDALAQGLDDGAKPLVVLLRDMLAAVERSLAVGEREELKETGLRSTARCCGHRRHRQANSVRVCSPASRRVASLRPRSAGLTALTPAPRTLVQAGSC